MNKMRRLIKIIPIPISGLMLALAALGNLVGSYSNDLRYVLGSFSTLLFIILTLKIILNFEQIRNGFDKPIIAGVMATYPMTMMILSTYIIRFYNILSKGLFSLGVLIHIFIILIFIKKYLLKFDINNFLPTNFIVFTGITCASVASKALSMETIGKVFFWVGLAGLIVMYPLVTKRMINNRLKGKIIPIFAIYTAPTSLCLAGYLSTYSKSDAMFYFLIAFATLNLIIVLSQIPKILRTEFNPTYSALTFPFVITAIAIKMSNISTIYTNITTLISIGFVMYVFSMYSRMLISQLSENEIGSKGREILT